MTKVRWGPQTRKMSFEIFRNLIWLYERQQSMRTMSSTQECIAPSGKGLMYVQNEIWISWVYLSLHTKDCLLMLYKDYFCSALVVALLSFVQHLSNRAKFYRKCAYILWKYAAVGFYKTLNTLNSYSLESPSGYISAYFHT